MVDAPPPQRIVPGAPPPTPLSKSQIKKKRKTKAKTNESTPDSPVTIPDAASAALVDKAPEPSDVQEGTIAPELVAQPEETKVEEELEVSWKPSPIVELVQKRLKATTKKIVCLSALPRMRRVSIHF